ncbi:MAG: hypothetical protein K6B44_04505 [Lachnospiraceae bacterium]|nr:hypothetical protein [Lachnospiraceae bacterium]
MEQKIRINNEEEYRAFLKKLPLYRSILKRFTKFSISAPVYTEKLKDFETALNLKNRRKRITFLFDRACDIIDKYNEENGISCCYNSEGFCEDPKHQKKKNGCCFLCYLQSENGCPTRNLSCKLYFCDHICKKYHPLTMDDIDLLRMFSPSQREIIKSNVFVTRKTYINLLCLNSYLLFCMYSVLKFFRLKNLY